MDLNDKNVVYLGGFGGIGVKCLKEFLQKGIKNLVIFDLFEKADIAEEWRKSYPAANIHFVQMDITQKESVEAAYEKAVEKMQHIDVVVNGCGLMDDRFITESIEINLLGPINSTLTAIKYMDKSKGGRGGVIVNISSVVGLEPSAMFAVYSAAKCGVTGFTRALSNPLLFARTGIAFVTICPGFTETALLDTPADKVTFKFSGPLMSERFQLVKRQSADECAKNLVKSVELAKNGAVWLLDLGEMKEIEFPIFWKPTLKTDK